MFVQEEVTGERPVRRCQSCCRVGGTRKCTGVAGIASSAHVDTLALASTSPRAQELVVLKTSSTKWLPAPPRGGGCQSQQAATPAMAWPSSPGLVWLCCSVLRAVIGRPRAGLQSLRRASCRDHPAEGGLGHSKGMKANSHVCSFPGWG